MVVLAFAAALVANAKTAARGSPPRLALGHRRMRHSIAALAISGTSFTKSPSLSGKLDLSHS
jgi:hypothetical protein